MRKKPNPIKTGDRFTTNEGCEVIVVGYDSAVSVKIKFPGGSTAVTQSSNLRRGCVKDPMLGIRGNTWVIGSGEYKSKCGGRITRSYRHWRGMIERCYYDPVKEKNPSYKGCSVSIDWQNFQNFAKWYATQRQANVDGIQVDKDILIPGNKIYSADTCLLVPREINSTFIARGGDRGDYPIGVSWHIQHEKYSARCSIGKGTLKHLGYFNSPISAHEAYRDFKEAHVRKLAEKYKHEIDPRAYHALMCYKVTCPTYEAMI